MRPWQARKEKSQKIRTVEGEFSTVEMGLQCLLEGGDSRTVSDPLRQLIPTTVTCTVNQIFSQYHIQERVKIAFVCKVLL